MPEHLRWIRYGFCRAGCPWGTPVAEWSFQSMGALNGRVDLLEQSTTLDDGLAVRTAGARPGPRADPSVPVDRGTGVEGRDRDRPAPSHGRYRPGADGACGCGRRRVGQPCRHDRTGNLPVRDRGRRRVCGRADALRFGRRDAFPESTQNVRRAVRELGVVETGPGRRRAAVVASGRRGAPDRLRGCDRSRRKPDAWSKCCYDAGFSYTGRTCVAVPEYRGEIAW